MASSGDCSEERTRAGGIDERVRCYQDERSGGTRGSQIRVQHSSVLKSRHSIWVRYKIADMAICSRCMHAYLNAMMLGVATGSPHALHAMISRIAAGYPLIGVIDPDSQHPLSAPNAIWSCHTTTGGTWGRLELRTEAYQK